jgi:hypothetical protein
MKAKKKVKDEKKNVKEINEIKKKERQRNLSKKYKKIYLRMNKCPDWKFRLIINSL